MSPDGVKGGADNEGGGCAMGFCSWGQGLDVCAD